jgi:SAM-dependent methyltransferase
MCTRTCLEFVRAHICEEGVRGRKVLEVGSRDVNGSARPIVEAFGPASYIGVDIEPGPGVDEICDATRLVDRFGRSAFDMLISTELLEHVREWRRVISQFKQVLKPGGMVVLTTRSPGFHYHAYPADFWRYEVPDMRAIFSDFTIEALDSDPLSPGVFVKARKPVAFIENDTRDLSLFSILTRRRALDVTDAELASFLRRWKFRRVVRAPSRFLRRIRDKVLGRKRSAD